MKLATVVLVVVAVLSGNARGDNKCEKCAALQQQINQLGAEAERIVDPRSPERRLLTKQIDDLDAQEGALGCGSHVLAVPDDPSNAGVPTKVAIFHLYLGTFFTTAPGKAFIRATDTQWRTLIGDSHFYDVLQQYDMSSSHKITGYFAGSETFTFSTHLDHDSYSSVALMSMKEWQDVVTEAITSPKLSLDNGGTPLFVIFFPPNVNRETSSGSNKPMAVNGWHGQMNLTRAKNVAPRLSLVAFILNLHDAAARSSRGSDMDIVESHEIYETITNSDHHGWHHGTEELADVCENSSSPSYTLDSTQIAKIWSNNACGCAP